MNDKKQPQHVYEYDEAGMQVTQQQMNDAYESGFIGDGYMAATYEDVVKEAEERG
ncbi:hypothetical protein ACFOU2_06725 [Bacillus songklensis]|uniref:Uncharacterized protein n=1 Tax=Bacillus songklensis TaxID=1069116 RepID=A0ABV8AZ14_9BACI